MLENNSPKQNIVHAAQSTVLLFARLLFYGVGLCFILPAVLWMLGCTYMIVVTITSGYAFSLTGLGALISEVALAGLGAFFGWCGMQGFAAGNEIAKSQPSETNAKCMVKPHESLLRSSAKPASLYRNELVRSVTETTAQEEQLLRGWPQVMREKNRELGS